MEQVAVVGMRGVNIVLPVGIARISLDEAFPVRLRTLVVVKRGREVALIPQHTADVTVGEGKVALPVGIAWIDRDEAFPDRLRGLVAVERGREVALSPQHAADVGVGEGKVALPTGIAGLDRY